MRALAFLSAKIVARCIACKGVVHYSPFNRLKTVMRYFRQTDCRKNTSGIRFPYRGNSNILTLPIEHHGLDFPSVARISMGLVTEGLARDLNHHLPSYQRVALVTLSDWTCGINGCVGPLGIRGLQCNFSHYYKKIPAAWITVQNTLAGMKPKLSLRLTDNSHILHGEISISHTLNLCNANGIAIPNGHVIRSMSLRGLRMLDDVGSWTQNTNRKLTLNVTDGPFPSKQNGVSRRENTGSN